MRDLVDHLIEGPQLLARTLQNGDDQSTGATSKATSEKELLDEVVNDPAAAYHRATDTVRRVLRVRRGLWGTVATPHRHLPAAWAARLLLVDQLVHGWDLAVATEQETTIPPQALKLADTFVRELVDYANRRPKGFGVEVSIGEQATPTECFVALLGRDPRQPSRIRNGACPAGNLGFAGLSSVKHDEQVRSASGEHR